MKPKPIPSLALWACFLASVGAEPLLTKPDLGNFNIKGSKECWTLKDGILTGVNDPGMKGSNLWTKEEYADFTLEGEFRFSGKIDSGIFIRTENDQIQIGVSWSLKKDMTCSPYIAKIGKYPVTAGVEDILKEGEWNKFVITAKGNRYVVSLNGRQVLDYASETSVPEGPIGFQVHPGVEMKIEFRNLDAKSENPAK